MPGLAFKGPRRNLQLDPPASSFSDFFSAPDGSLSSDHHFLHSRATAACLSPLTPTKHKACRPSQASWMLNLKEDDSKFIGRDGSCPTTKNDYGFNNNNNNNSCEKEHDLADMVHEFLENGSCDHDQCDSDVEGRSSKLCDSLKALGSQNSSLEATLLSKITSLLLSVNGEANEDEEEEEKEKEKEKEKEESMYDEGECKGGCVRRLIVKELKAVGYDAAVCKLEWQVSGNVPGGDYEYVEVVNKETSERVIVDVEFQSQFEIARPTQHYMNALKNIPPMFVGSIEKVSEIVKIMCEAAKLSLSQKSLHLPPWRTIDYMLNKWLSPPLIIINNINNININNSLLCCSHRLKRIKEAMINQQHHHHHTNNNINNNNNNNNLNLKFNINIINKKMKFGRSNSSRGFFL